MTIYWTLVIVGDVLWLACSWRNLFWDHARRRIMWPEAQLVPILLVLACSPLPLADVLYRAARIVLARRKTGLAQSRKDAKDGNGKTGGEE